MEFNCARSRVNLKIDPLILLKHQMSNQKQKLISSQLTVGIFKPRSGRKLWDWGESVPLKRSDYYPFNCE